VPATALTDFLHQLQPFSQPQQPQRVPTQAPNSNLANRKVEKSAHVEESQLKSKRNSTKGHNNSSYSSCQNGYYSAVDDGSGDRAIGGLASTNSSSIYKVKRQRTGAIAGSERDEGEPRVKASKRPKLE